MRRICPQLICVACMVSAQPEMTQAISGDIRLLNHLKLLRCIYSVTVSMEANLANDRHE